MMKKLSILLVALLVLCLALPTSAFAAEEKVFWVTHFNEGSAEGAGSVFTETDTAGGWWIHVAFAPTNVENTYEIVAKSDGIADGSATALPVPEGGFVWAANTGNNYPALYQQYLDDPATYPSYSGMGELPDYTNPSCSTIIAEAQAWQIGDKITITGVDIASLTVPTTTSDVNWYDDAYMCSATYAVYEGDATVVTPSDDSSEPAASADGSSESDDDSSKTSESEVTESNDSDASADEDGDKDSNSTILWIVIAAVVVVAVVVVVVVVLKKKN